MNLLNIIRKRAKRYLVLLLLISFVNLPVIDTKAVFTTSASIGGGGFSAGCWTAPSVPVLTSPLNNTIANSGSPWILNPLMDWEDSTSSCAGAIIEYQYELYRDSGLTSLANQSGWLSTSQIPAPGTPDGTYYWHVRARDQWGHISEFSAPWLLTVDRTAPPIPYLISPGNNTQLNSSGLVQTWQEVFDNLGGDVIYNYESYSDAGLTTLRYAANYSNSANGDGLVVTKHAEGAPNGDVYWRVRAIDARGNVSGWSQVWRFSIVNTLPNPSPEPSPAPPTTNIVLNEILPNPLGGGTTMPNGEWVELYNRSDTPIDVNGWHITDLADLHDTEITGAKTNTSGTVIAPHGWLVVYFNSSILNNTGDTVNLYSGVVNPINLIDSHLFGSTPAGKSIARIPDGGPTWYDPIPTPGEPNKLEEGIIFSTPQPTASPEASPTILPSVTPIPTESSQPTPSPESSPMPLEIPEPSPTPTIAPTPAPGPPPTTEPAPTEPASPSQGGTPAPIETPQI